MKIPPQIKIETLEQEVVAQGFLGIDRRKVKISYPNMGPFSIDPQFMTIDSVVRKANDAVAIIAYFKLNNEYYIYMRSCLRPALALRDFDKDSERPEPYGSGVENLWEIPAGLVDANERGWGGLVMAAQRELHEEIGIFADIIKFKPFGPRYFSSAGMSAERIFFFAVEVNPLTIDVPEEDGSALEMGGIVHAYSLTELREALENEEILDAKTQMAIMRFSARLDEVGKI